MMKVDFLILFEHRERELENACLIKHSLEKRGYKVRIESIYSLAKYMVKAKVIIVPHLYDDEQVRQFLTKYGNRECSVINMQYEQVISKNDIDWGYSIPKGQAKKSVVFAWGDAEADRCRENDQRYEVVGNISMDLNYPLYDKYFLGKEELFGKYGLALDKPILLFISSFSASDPELIKQYIAHSYKGAEESHTEFMDISIQSQKEIITWLCRLHDEREDLTIVYRPHPAESDNKLLLEAERTYERFKIIKDYTIRQWVRMADYLCTWFSTSIVDAYYADKYCSILRPVKIPEHADVPFFINARIFSTYDEFKGGVFRKDAKFPADTDNIYYHYGPKEPKLDFFIEHCINIYENNLFLETWEKTGRDTIGHRIGSFFRDVLFDLSKKHDVRWIYKLMLSRRVLTYSSAMRTYEELHDIDKRVEEYEERLGRI